MKFSELIDKAMTPVRAVHNWIYGPDPTDEELLRNAKFLGPVPPVTIHNASIDEGKSGVYRVRYYKGVSAIGGYTTSGSKLAACEAQALLTARYHQATFVEIFVLSATSAKQ